MSLLFRNAVIVVRIKNQGEGAYLPDDYGKSIIIERHFSKNGTSGFKIKSENGRIVSTKKAELESIIDCFGLQFDNPMNVLSQDMARQFLSSSSPADKYKFFVKGVQLEQLDQDYRLIEESVDQIEEKLRDQDQDLKILATRRDAAQHKLKLSDEHETLRQRIRDLRAQMAWAQVEEQERVRKLFWRSILHLADAYRNGTNSTISWPEQMRKSKLPRTNRAVSTLRSKKPRAKLKRPLNVCGRLRPGSTSNKMQKKRSNPGLTTKPVSVMTYKYCIHPLHYTTSADLIGPTTSDQGAGQIGTVENKGNATKDLRRKPPACCHKWRKLCSKKRRTRPNTTAGH